MSKFLSLPVEIRREIYRHVLRHDVGNWVELPLSSSEPGSPMRSDDEYRHQYVRLWLGIPRWTDRFERPRSTPPSCQMGILMTSRQTYQEVFPILYQEREFHCVLGTGFEASRLLDNARLYNTMKHLNTNIIWENASSEHIILVFKTFALRFPPQGTLSIRVTVLNEKSNVKFEQWFINAIAGLTAYEKVFFSVIYRPREADTELNLCSNIEEGVRHALGPAVWSSSGLLFRPKDYNDERIRAQIMYEQMWNTCQI